MKLEMIKRLRSVFAKIDEKIAEILNLPVNVDARAKFRDPRNGVRKWAWEMDDMLKERAELQRELREEMSVKEYEHIIEIRWSSLGPVERKVP
jgi:hypothetical protein